MNLPRGLTCEDILRYTYDFKDDFGALHCIGKYIIHNYRDYKPYQLEGMISYMNHCVDRYKRKFIDE